MHLGVDIKQSTLKEIVECILADVTAFAAEYTIGQSIEATGVFEVASRRRASAQSPTAFELVGLPRPEHVGSPLPTITVDDYELVEQELERPEQAADFAAPQSTVPAQPPEPPDTVQPARSVDVDRQDEPVSKASS